MFVSQSMFDVRFDWGLNGVVKVANHAPVTIIVDVLSFCTSVEIACARGACVIPYREHDASAEAFARASNAVLASKRSAGGFSLSPASLLDVDGSTRLVLPSPNGSTIALSCTSQAVLAGCFRNAKAVAKVAERAGGPISLIAAAEKWPDGSPRFAFEDLVGAGAIIHELSGTKSPEAMAAQSAYLGVKDSLAECLMNCASGRELVTRGFEKDVELAACLNASSCVPQLKNGAFNRIDELTQPYCKEYAPLNDETFSQYQNALQFQFTWGAFEAERCVAIAIAEPEVWNNSLQVLEFHVAQPYRRCGIGRRLIDALAARASAAGLRTIVCETQTTNVPAIRFYRSTGFMIEGIDLSHYSNDDFPDGEIAVFVKRRL